MFVLALIALNTSADTSSMRLILLLLVILAVGLILLGSCIALLTLRKRLKADTSAENAAPMRNQRT